MRKRFKSPRGKKTSRMKDFLLNFSSDTDGTSGAVGLGDNRVYKAVLNRGTSQEEQATSDRHFCSKCSAMLWLWDETWYDGRTPTSHTFFLWINSQSLYNLHGPTFCIPSHLQSTSQSSRLQKRWYVSRFEFASDFFKCVNGDPISDCVDGALDEVGTGVCAPARRKEKDFQGISKAIAGGVAQGAR